MRKSTVLIALILLSLPMVPIESKGNSPLEKTAVAQSAYRVRPIYLYPSDFPFKQQNLDALKEGMAQIKAWYFKATGGYSFDYYEPIALKASQPLSWFKCVDQSGCTFTESVDWGRIQVELNNRGYPVCGSTINFIVMDGGGGFAGGGWCGSKNSGGLAVVGTWTFQAHYGDYKCKDYYECNTGAAWGAAAHEIGHVFGMGHTDDFAPGCASVMQQHWDFPKVNLCTSTSYNEVDFLKSLNYFSLKKTTNDSSLPNVSLLSPTNSSTVSGYIPFIAQASDNDLNRVEYYVDNQLFAINSLTFDNHIYATIGKSNGPHTLYVRAVDWAENSRSTTPITVNFANSLTESTKPTGGIVQPANNANASGLTNIVANAVDSSGIDTVYFGQHWQIIDKKPDNGTSNYSTQINFNGQYLGKHTLNLRITDKAGNITPYLNISVNNNSVATKPGDFNNDSRVDSGDLTILISTWGSTTDLRADMNGNGKIDSSDLAQFISKWGS